MNIWLIQQYNARMVEVKLYFFVSLNVYISGGGQHFFTIFEIVVIIPYCELKISNIYRNVHTRY